MTFFEIDKHLIEWINNNRIVFLDPVFIGITKCATIVSIAFAFIVLIKGFYKKDLIYKIRGWQMVAALAMNSIIVNILKYSINRERPFISDPLVHKLSTGGSPSFPSGHTADAFVIVVTMSLLFVHKKGWLIPVWLWACAIAYSRMALGVHYPSDVLGGMIVGAFNAYLVQHLFSKRRMMDLSQEKNRT